MRAPFLVPLALGWATACSTTPEKDDPVGQDTAEVTDTDDGGDTDTVPPDTADTGEDTADPAPVYPDLTVATCGAEAYDYLPVDDMGSLVAHEPDLAFSLPASAIQALLDSQGLGDLLDARYDVALHKVRYLTQDRGEPVETTGYVAFPVLETPGPVPTMLWTHPTLGFADACAPSSGSLEGAAFPVLAATMGYAVAAPDYLGMNGWGEPSDRLHSWVVGEPTAIASLDSLRATARLAEELGTTATPDLAQVIALGASQGGHAALMADHYAQAYAPEVQMIGVIAAIPVTDMEAVARFGMLNPVEATLGLAGGTVTAWDWYGRSADLGEVLVPELAETLPVALETACGDDFGELAGDIDSPDDVYTAEALARAEADTLGDWEPWACYQRESSLLHNTATTGHSMVPKLMVIGSEDTLAYAPPVRADAEALCDAGVPIDLIECEGLGHVDAAVENLPLFLSWAEDRLAGVPMMECDLQAPKDCRAD